MKIEFFYFSDCPNQHKAFEILQSVLKEQSISDPIERIEIVDDADANNKRFVGSPTIRIDGVDVDRLSDYLPYAKVCRVYLVQGRLTGIPTKEMIETALHRAEQQRPQDITALD